MAARVRLVRQRFRLGAPPAARRQGGCHGASIIEQYVIYGGHLVRLQDVLRGFDQDRATCREHHDSRQRGQRRAPYRGEEPQRREDPSPVLEGAGVITADNSGPESMTVFSGCAHESPGPLEPGPYPRIVDTGWSRSAACPLRGGEDRSACIGEPQSGCRACHRDEPGIYQPDARELIAEAEAVDGQRVPGVVGDRAAVRGDRPEHGAVPTAQLGENCSSPDAHPFRCAGSDPLRATLKMIRSMKSPFHRAGPTPRCGQTLPLGWGNLPGPAVGLAVRVSVGMILDVSCSTDDPYDPRKTINVLTSAGSSSWPDFAAHALSRPRRKKTRAVSSPPGPPPERDQQKLRKHEG
jgi:hypothetical protein